MSAVAINVATGGTAPWWPTMDSHPLRWTAGSIAAVVGAGLLMWWVQRHVDRRLAILVPAQERPQSWVVDRPAEVDRIVAALRRRSGVTVVIPHHRFARCWRIWQDHCRKDGAVGSASAAPIDGLVYWVTLGRDARRGPLTDKVNDLIRCIEPDRPVTFTDAQQAGRYLASLLTARPRRLIVLDDVWYPEQIEAFPTAARSTLLVTTRNSIDSRRSQRADQSGSVIRYPGSRTPTS